jgi:hypothetical protein
LAISLTALALSSRCFKRGNSNRTRSVSLIEIQCPRNHKGKKEFRSILRHWPWISKRSSVSGFCDTTRSKFDLRKSKRTECLEWEACRNIVSSSLFKHCSSFKCRRCGSGMDVKIVPLLRWIRLNRGNVFVAVSVNWKETCWALCEYWYRMDLIITNR